MNLYATHSELVAPVVVATIRIEDETNLVTLELSRLSIYIYIYIHVQYDNEVFMCIYMYTNTVHVY